MTSSLSPGFGAMALEHKLNADHARRSALPVTLTVITIRRDGKLAVSYCFPGAGRNIGKLLTLAQFRAEVARHPDWVITGVPVPPAPVNPVPTADAARVAAYIADATGESNY